MPAPANPANNDKNADDAPAGPNAPSQNQPVPINPAGPTVPVPNLQPAPNQPAPLIIHQKMLNWSRFKPEFAGTPDKMWKHIFFVQMTGW